MSLTRDGVEKTQESASEFVCGLPARICDVVTMGAQRSPDRLALLEATGSWTYGQLEKIVAETRTWLVMTGVRPGDRVVIVCENCRALVAILFALATLDAWPVLVNAQLATCEIEQIRNHCGARLVIYTTATSPRANEHAKRQAAVVEDAGGLGPIAISPLNQQAVVEPLDARVGENVGALIYTSGTTGLPKGVMLTHRNLLFVAAGAARIRSLSADDRMLGVLPISHAVGLSVVLLGTLLSGASLYLLPRFDPIRTPGLLVKQRVTILLGVPAMFGQLLEYAQLRGLRKLHCPDLRVISSSGAPLPQAIKSAAEDLFGLALHNGYGITECSPTVAQTRLDEPRQDTSVGRVFPGVEIRIVGSDGKLVAEGDSGELRVRGPNVMKGYYRARAETSEVIDSEGWFNSRDLARVEDGNLFIVGRTKELIVHLGLNVYPAEVEAVLNAHPAVLRSAVMGRSIQGDEEIIAFVQPNPHWNTTTTELREHAASHLASYKRPSKIFLVSEMPVTPTGKIVKAELAKFIPHAGAMR